jgi:hypothetical protein
MRFFLEKIIEPNIQKGVIMFELEQARSGTVQWSLLANHSIIESGKPPEYFGTTQAELQSLVDKATEAGYELVVEN